MSLGRRGGEGAGGRRGEERDELRKIGSLGEGVGRYSVGGGSGGGDSEDGDGKGRVVKRGRRWRRWGEDIQDGEEEVDKVETKAEDEPLSEGNEKT